MARIRFFVAILAALSIVAGFWLGVGRSDWLAAGALIAAAACLAAVCPFDAPDPRRRIRVAIACTSYVALVGVLIVVTYSRRVSGWDMIGLFLLLEAGVGLAGWAFATRNRTRLPGSRRYYDV